MIEIKLRGARGPSLAGMQSPLQITFRDLPHSAALEMLEEADRHKRHGRQFNVRALREAFETAVRR